MIATVGKTVEILLVEDDRLQGRMAETALSSPSVAFEVIRAKTLAEARSMID